MLKKNISFHSFQKKGEAQDYLKCFSKFPIFFHRENWEIPQTLWCTCKNSCLKQHFTNLKEKILGTKFFSLVLPKMGGGSP